MKWLNKIDMWVAENPLKYHLYTKMPLVILVCFILYIN